ncbi:type VI secretion system protein TssA [Terriglobus sp. RCC_193]|uniref:type VI secretion system protein TssA n=1 Tax=Terriglobus sp. RCC_193 TaxID=3239218 RepID=UPI003524B492
MSASGRMLTEVESLLQPIREDAPVGESLRYSATWDAILQARSADMGLPVGEWQREEKRADWAQVKQLCIDALTTQSKDLQLAVWLAEAWVHLSGLDGVVAGAELLRELHRHYPLTMFPVEQPGETLTPDTVEYRVNLVRILNQKMALEVRFIPVSDPSASGQLRYSLADLDQKKFEDQAHRRENPGTPPEEDPFRAFEEADASTSQAFYATLAMKVKRALAEIVTLDALLDEVYGKENPGLNAIKRELERILQHLVPRLRVMVPEAVVEETVNVDIPDLAQNVLENPAIKGGFKYDGLANPPSTWNVSQEEALTAPATGNGVRQGPVNRTQAYEMIRQAADYLARTEPHSPVPYLLRRALRWGSLSLQELLPELLQNPEQLTADTLHGGAQDGSGFSNNDPFRY